jgi:N-acyl-D-aspartate/D-glutamate deacylase
MHDLVIRGGRVVDGTGSAARRADVAIDGDRIAAVGDAVGPARRTLDADGCLVTPGFVDVHTHLDAQIGWDPLGTSSCWHGVTSVVMGNCGVTFAPVRSGDRRWLAELMESVEDIPAESILAGLPWDWESYGGYLDSLARRPLGLNVGGLVGHCAVRWWAMGERSLAEGAEPSGAELAVMQSLVDEAMAAGALGFSTSRTLRHKVPDGRCVPGTWASGDELLALAEVLGRRGRGVFEVSPRFDGEGPALPRVESELAWMEQVSRRSGRPLTFNLTQTAEQGDHWRRAIELSEAANARGARIRPQTTSRGIGVLFGLWNLTPFDRSPAWQALKGLVLAEKLAALRDPERRARLLAEAEAASPRRETLERFFVLTPAGGARYEPDPGASLLAEAERRGVSPARAFVELCLETEGRVILNWPILNHDFACIAEMLTTPVVLMGLADSGAHVGQILDASQPTWFLTHWARERGLLSVEEAVRRISADTAGFVGLVDRGVLRPGAFADLNVIDWEALALPLPEYVHDFPGGAGRFVQRAQGYRHTLVNGQPFLEDGRHTGAFAGRVLRSGPDLRERAT